MNKDEFSLIKAFNALETSYKCLVEVEKNASNFRSGVQWNYYCNYIKQVGVDLDNLREKFYSIILDVEESEEDE